MRKLSIIFTVWMLADGCLQSYFPPALANPGTSLVVEGFIDSGPDSTFFTLSHTMKVTDSIPVYTYELGATVTIEGNDNSSHPLGEVGNGVYAAQLSGLNPGVSYRIHIGTVAGKQYASDYVPVVANPPIDSINWVRLPTGIQTYANTHDPTGNAKYFRYDYTETWEFHSAYFASVAYSNGQVYNYAPNTIATCWKTDNATNVLIGSSTSLSQSVLYEFPLVLIPINSQQLSVEYSILVKQYALTKDAFSWWGILQNNTENIGSIFGVMPTTDPGNIHCLTDTSEQVVGYISAGNIQSQRIFITEDQVLPWDYNTGCKSVKIPTDSLLEYVGMGMLPYYSSINPPYLLMAYPECIDCTLSGSNVRPSFWP